MTVAGPLAPNRRMPTAFGPAPGPRNVPIDACLPEGPARRSVVSFAAEVPPDAVQELLPARVALRRPQLDVQLVTFENLTWFAGRGYDVLSVSVPVRYTCPDTTVDADFLLVMWENNADPVITGRDELGFPKLFADIEVTGAAQVRRLGVLRAQASWDRTPFFHADVHDFEPAAPMMADSPVLTHRYVPAVGNLGTADADYLTIAESGPVPSITHSAVAAGTFAFRPVTWNEVPLQYPTINALAGIDVSSIGPVRFVCSEGGGFGGTSPRK